MDVESETVWSGGAASSRLTRVLDPPAIYSCACVVHSWIHRIPT